MNKKKHPADHIHSRSIGAAKCQLRRTTSAKGINAFDLIPRLPCLGLPPGTDLAAPLVLSVYVVCTSFVVVYTQQGGCHRW